MCSHPKVFKHRLVNCGECVSCRKRRISDWSLRMEFERRNNSDKSLFITLTYNSENLPSNTLLCKKDLQNFFKRLRSRIKYYGLDCKITYFASGEYGDKKTKNYRPHYHICLFGLPLTKFTYNLILKSWNKGFIDVEILNFQNARYVSKYCVKNFQKEKIDLKTGEIVKEFVTMSRRSGIGFCVLKNQDWLNQVSNQGFIKLGKFKYSVPYAFKRKLKDTDYFKKKEITIFYNERMYKGLFSNFLTSDSGFNLLSSLSKEIGRHISMSNIKIKTFHDLVLELESKRQKEMEYFQKVNKDYYQYYKISNLFDILHRDNYLCFDKEKGCFMSKIDFLYSFSFFFY